MKWRVADFIVIAVVLLLAAGIWLYPAFSVGGESAEIRQFDKTRTLSLKNDTTVNLEKATLQVKDGAISIVQADCPDQVCVKTGAIFKEGQSIVCVPNQIVITIKGEGETDAISN